MKRNCGSIALFLVLFVFSVIISSCEDSGTESLSTRINISGKISASLNFPVSNVIVKVEDKVTTTSADGEFSLSDVTTPYDLKIIDTSRKAGYIYKGLSRTDLDISLYYIPQNNSAANINLTYPASLSNFDGKAIFTDGNQKSYYGNLPFISVVMGNNTTITGKVILIFFTRDNDSNIISYDRYGEKDNITISAGGTTNVDFTLNDLQLNPGEVTVSGNISGQQGLSTSKFYCLSFGKRYTSGYISNLSFSQIQDDTFNLVLPTNLPSDFTPLIFLYAQGTYPNSQISEQFILPKGGTGINLSLHNWPSLINPTDNATNIDASTLFEWASGSGNGIYGITITNPANTVTYTIYTNLTSITLADINSFGLGNINNKVFSWSCEKYGSVSSLNEYLDPERNNIGYYRATTSTRTFSTKP
ncbi:MAG: hypothetical protein WC358_07440 [Ignavibacteria bacterium]|jgi:hypothetical protein